MLRNLVNSSFGATCDVMSIRKGWIHLVVEVIETLGSVDLCCLIERSCKENHTLSIQ